VSTLAYISTWYVCYREVLRLCHLMSADEYLQAILSREAVDISLKSPVRGVLSLVGPTIEEWANGRLLSLNPSGSFAKGTANASGTDIDLFIALSSDTIESLGEIYQKLFNWMTDHHYAPKKQNVSINIKVNGISVDLVPGKRQNSNSLDYSICRRKADTWTKTNVFIHAKWILQSGRTDEIRIIKLWRDQKGLEFPSFYLELTVIRALHQAPSGALAQNVWKVFQYLRDSFMGARVVDPANSNNVISDDLTVPEQARVKAAATEALKATLWSEIVQ
jgi:hypothetical protein